MTRTISNTDSIIDSRNVIERIKDLEDQLKGEWGGLVGETDENRT